MAEEIVNEDEPMAHFILSISKNLTGLRQRIFRLAGLPNRA
jgi:hypothetical protein